MRRGESLALRWGDLDLEAGTVVTERSLVAVGCETTISMPKNGKRRAIDLDPQTVAVLRAHRKRQLAEKLALGPGYDDQGLVFVREDGTAVHPDRASKMFDAHAKRSGLPRIRLHDLLHTHVSHLAKAGAHPKVVQERMGHHSPAFTLERYGHLFPSMQREAADKIGELMGGLTAVQD
jgi:integrase